ncbi:MAG: hypothetical protein ACLUR9_05035 [Christensenellales bacterium]
MKYTAEEMEKAAVWQTAQRMCATVRTAPKARGIDHLDSCVVTEETLITLAEEMEKLGSQREGYEFLSVMRKMCGKARPWCWWVPHIIHGG